MCYVLFRWRRLIKDSCLCLGESIAVMIYFPYWCSKQSANVRREALSSNQWYESSSFTREGWSLLEVLAYPPLALSGVLALECLEMLSQWYRKCKLHRVNQWTFVSRYLLSEYQLEHWLAGWARRQPDAPAARGMGSHHGHYADFQCHTSHGGTMLAWYVHSRLSYRWTAYWFFCTW